MTITLETSIEQLPRVGKTTAALFKKIGITNCRDLLFTFPFRYVDFREITPLIHVQGNTFVCVEGKIKLLHTRRLFKQRMGLTEALIEDKTGSIKVIWFRQPYLANSLIEGASYRFAGRVDAGKYGIQLVNPVFEKKETTPTHTGRVIPIYSTTDRLSQKLIRGLMKIALPLAKNIPDPLSEDLRKQYNLMPMAKSVEVIHFPITIAHAHQARERIALQELIDLLTHLSRKRSLLHREKSFHPAVKKEMLQRAIDQLPFKLTQSQHNVLQDILNDLGNHFPMNRIIIGDVGSGKTVLAHLAASALAHNGLQTSMLAPTDILARQHFKTLQKLFPHFPGTVALFTRTQKYIFESGQETETTKKEIIKRLQNGTIAYCVGTHALIQGTVHFSQLGLVMVDEQHRFGVLQRGKGVTEFKSRTSIVPHYLQLSATPIPRSLARIICGGSDVSLLTEKPSNRIPVKTVIVNSDAVATAYEHIRREVRVGHQTFIICPIIDPSDTLGVKSATEEYDRLKKEVFSDLPIGLLHGKLPAKTKEETMRKFAAGEISVVVATAVVEVGVDIPSANIMIIEGGERFGLAQLHQFRGRIGRSSIPSTCYVVAPANNPKASKRLSAFAGSTDGFKLAELDLTLRGPGELLGFEQSGFLPLRVATLTDTKLLALAKKIAEELLTRQKAA